MKKDKIQILFDHQIFSFQNFGGISRLFTELYLEFSGRDDLKCNLPIVFSDNEYLTDTLDVKPLLPRSKSIIKKLLVYGVNRTVGTFNLIVGNYDLFQPTYYDTYFLPFIRKKPFVLIVFDMTHELFPENISKKDKTVQWKKKLIGRASKIIAISENTKRDIIKFYNIDSNKIEVVYLGNSLILDKKRKEIDLPSRYILYTGNRKGYKNFDLFFKSISNLLNEQKDLYLVCAGGGEFSQKEQDMIDSYSLSDKVIHIKFSDNQELAQIYNRATCFVFPSLYEGFGIPVLEAFACECPCIISNSSSLPEVGGDAVEYFNPKSSKSMERSIAKVLESEELRENLLNKGKERLKMFNWKYTANNVLDIYYKILK